MNFRFEKILTHPEFTEAIKQTKEFEADRIFCCHGMEHLLSVARIAYILSLERNYDLTRDVIYACALLHDIGRATEYRTGISHSKAGAQTAERILCDCGYDDAETAMITDTILSHHHDSTDGSSSQLRSVICSDDRLSRNCFDCSAYDLCNWTEEEKNSTLAY
jgi:uncharacterized protein